MSCAICRRVKFGNYAHWAGDVTVLMRPAHPLVDGQLLFAPKAHLVLPKLETLGDVVLAAVAHETLLGVARSYAELQRIDADVLIPAPCCVEHESHLFAMYVPWRDGVSLAAEVATLGTESQLLLS